MSLASAGTFDHIQRVAKLFSESQLVPTIFQKNMPNVVIALEMAARMNAGPLMVMQNLHVIHGKPTFSAAFNIAAVNACGKFTPLRFIYVGAGGTDDWGCYAVAKSRDDNAELRGVTVTIAMAKAEGWMTKNGSKWKTMPQLMLSYRAATWWTRMYSPELLMGMSTEDEAIDVLATTATEPDPATEPTVVRKARGVSALRAEKKTEPVNVTPPPVVEPVVEPTTAAPATAPEPAAAPAPAAEPAAEPSATAPAATESAAATETEAVPDLPQMTRVEIKSIVEIPNAKKGNGVVGPVCKLEISSAAFKGLAFYNGPAANLPSVGTLIDAEFTDANLAGQAVKKFENFVVVG